MNPVITGLRAALLLAHGRAEGVRLVANDRTAVIQSFWAIPLCLPALICLRLLDLDHAALLALTPLKFGVLLGRNLAQFTVAWLLFMVISHALLDFLKKQPDWPRFIAIWAWCSVIENTLAALGSLPGPLGLPAIVSQVCVLVSIGWALWLEYYAIRLTLGGGALTAVGLLVIDMIIGEAMSVIGAMAG